MSLKEVFHRVARKAGLGLCALTLAFTAGCGYPSHQLGQDPAVPATAVTESMFDGAAAQQHVFIDGASLQAKNNYTYDGPVTVRGNVPANTEIKIENGRLEVTGNVGSGSTIDVQMPVNSHDETYHYTTFMMVGKVMIPMMQTGHRTIIDGLAFPNDQHAAVRVAGAIGDNVTIHTNGGIQAGAWGTELKVETGYGRNLQQVPAPVLPRPAS
jgi:hypothetical protein